MAVGPLTPQWSLAGTPPTTALDAFGTRELAVQTLIEAVDQLRHRLELLRDHPQPVFPEVLRLDIERGRERLDDVVRRHRAVPVHQVVQVARREPRLRS